MKLGFDLNEALREAWRDMLPDSHHLDAFQIVAPDDIAHGEETLIGFRVDTISSLGRLNIEYAVCCIHMHIYVHIYISLSLPTPHHVMMIGWTLNCSCVLRPLFVLLQLPTPLKQIVSEESMAGYQNLFRFFLQLRVSKQIMEQTFLRRGGAHERALSQLRFEMLHIVNTLHQFIRDDIVADLWAKFNHDIANANERSWIHP
jgi:hypothetical protein